MHAVQTNKTFQLHFDACEHYKQGQPSVWILFHCDVCSDTDEFHWFKFYAKINPVVEKFANLCQVILLKRFVFKSIYFKGMLQYASLEI